jgi:ribonuclease P protein component
VPEREGYPRRLRLTRKREFDAVFERGEKLVGRHFVVHVLRHDGRDSRLGQVVSRKVGGAVVRNRLKRCIREAFRRHQGQFCQPLCMVVVARPGSAALRGDAVAYHLLGQLVRGGFMK